MPGCGRPTDAAPAIVARRMKLCCSPGASRTDLRTAATHEPAAQPCDDGLIALCGGSFVMGCEGPMVLPSDGEAPVRQASVAGFRLAATTVTIDRFATFVEATGFVTLSERLGWSFVFAGHLSLGLARLGPSSPGTPWWVAVPGACWHRPLGPAPIRDIPSDHPVTHVAHSDAQAYCDWSGTRLPDEAEWEYAARGGLEYALYPWGNELTPKGRHLCNTWQGEFPKRDTGEDGYVGTAPADAFAPNGYGFYQMTGNVWEWCQPSPDRPSPPGQMPVRGGSHLCHASYCSRYRVSSRLVVPDDSGTSHIGFRVAASN